MKTINSIENPWLGLKSYSEGKILYGRDKEIEELSQKILYNSQTVIYGKSGIGKSSLLKAGIFPILRRNGYFPVYVRFVHEEGQESYTNQIIAAVDYALKRLKIEDLGALDCNLIKVVEGYAEEVMPIYNDGRDESMWEYFHRHKFYYKLDEEDDAHEIFPVLIFDQFEEIFTLQKDASLVKKFFDEFAGLINNVCPKYLLESKFEADSVFSPLLGRSLIKRGVIKTAKKWDYIDDVNLHIVLSLREDFLSYLERNIEHIPSLKHNRYCLLSLNEDQAADIIMQPIPGLVSIDVAKEIISKVTGVSSDRFDIDDTPVLEVDSAILSLFLSELFVKKGKDDIITDKLVIQFGSNIISDFYEKSINDRFKISEASVLYLEKRLVTKEGRRDSIFEERALSNGITYDELKYLIDRRLLRQYTWRDGVRIEFSHDVLCPIVNERRLKRDELLEKQRQQELFLKVKRERKRLIVALISIIFLVLFITGLICDGLFDVKVKRYASVTKKTTWMTGVQKLSKDEASYLNCYYVFYQTGRWAKHPDSIEVRNGYGELTSEHNMGTYLVNQWDDTDCAADKKIVEDLKSVVKWVLVPDNSGKYCIAEKAYDKNGKLVFSYNNSIIEKDSTFISTYADAYGFPIVMRDSCYIFLRTTIDENGYEVLQEFFDDKGFPVSNKDSSFQTARTYFPNGMQKSESSLFLNGYRMVDRAGNCGWEILEMDDNGVDPILCVNFNAENKPCRTKEGVMFKCWDYDEYGRFVKETYWKIEEDYLDCDIETLDTLLERGSIKLLPDTNLNGVHGVVQEYNRHGKVTLFYNVDFDGNPIKASNVDALKMQLKYDDNGNEIQCVLVDENEKSYREEFAEYSVDGDLVYSKCYFLDEHADTSMSYHLYWDKEKNRKIEKDYYQDYYIYTEYDIDGKPCVEAWYKTMTNEPYCNDIGFHKILCDYQHDKENKQLTITETYFTVNENSCGYEELPLCKNVCIVDSVYCTKSEILYILENVLEKESDSIAEPIEIFHEGVEYSYNKDFTIILSEKSLGPDGVACRTYENEAYYYEIKYVYPVCSSHADSCGFYALNEFGEPSLYSGEYTYSAVFNGDYFDEYGHKQEGEIERFILATIVNGGDLGFKGGDILVQQDDWTWWPSEDAFDELDLKPQFDIYHCFKVLRFNEGKKEWDVVEINVPKGDERITHLDYLIFRMTRAEKDRVYRIMCDKIYNHIFALEPTEGGAIYERGLQSQAIFLSVNGWDMSRHFGGNGDSLISEFRRQKTDIWNVLVYNLDSEEVQEYVVDSDTLGVRIGSTPVSFEDYTLLKNEMIEYRNKNNDK